MLFRSILAEMLVGLMIHVDQIKILNRSMVHGKVGLHSSAEVEDERWL